MPKIEADLMFYENMKLIVEACTKWEWLKKLRMHQVDTYHWAVRYKGDSFYKGVERLKGIIIPDLNALALEVAAEYANDPTNKEYQFI